MDDPVSQAYQVSSGDAYLTMPSHYALRYLPNRAGYLRCEVTWHDTRDTVVATDWFLVELPARFPGDADEDENVDMNDALCILQYFMDTKTEINLNNADVNADEKVDAMDALLLLQYSAGWNVRLQ